MTSRQSIHNDKNVYILGAGFSRLAGLPLSSDFMNYMRDQHQNLASKMISESDRNYPSLYRPYQAIDAILKYRLSASSVNYRINIDLENIEELFSLGTIIASDSEFEKQIRVAISSVIHAAQLDIKKMV